MIVYNVTIKVSWNIAEEWQVWMRREHIPAFYRLLDQDETEGPTFVAQYSTSSLERYEQYRIEFAPAIQEEGRNKWDDQFVAFRTVMVSIGATVH
jgi:uncharacterized protein DUF4286